MFSPSRSRSSIVSDVTRVVISEYAPEELSYLQELIEPVIDRRDSRSAESEDEALAFGLAGAVVAITPVVASMVVAAMHFLSSELLQATKAQITAAVEAKLRALFPVKENASPLNVKQLEELKITLRRVAKHQGIKPELSERLVDSTIASLVMRLGAPS